MKSFLLFFVFILNTYGSEIEKLTELCKNSDSKACYEIGSLYYFGTGVRKDKNEAAKFYIKACESGYADGCLQAGSIYFIGDNVKIDHIKALELYTKACDSGEALGCSSLGRMYYNGFGVQENQIKALELYTKACNGGEVLACSHLGEMYDKGIGTIEDKHKAIELYTKACDFEYSSACIDAALLYGKDSWAEKDQEKAIKFYKKACHLGDPKGCDLAVSMEDVWEVYGVKSKYEMQRYEKLGFSPLEAIRLKKRISHIEPEIAFRLLSLFDAKQVYDIYWSIPMKDKTYPSTLNKAYFEPAIQYSERESIPLKDAISWYKYLNPESNAEVQLMTEYYKSGFEVWDAKDFVHYQVPVDKAKQYEKKVIKECGKDWKKVFVFLDSNPYMLKNKCYKMNGVEAISIINQSSAIYKYSKDTWVKIVDSNGAAKTYFSGVVKFTEPVKFIKPDGLQTMIPSAKSIATYSWF